MLGDPAAVRVSGARDELDPAPLERDEEENIDPGQPDGLHGEKVASEHRRRLLAQELPPACALTFGCGRQAVPRKHRTNGGGGDRDAEPAQLANDPPITPGRVLAREAKHEFAHVIVTWRPPSTPMPIRPATRYQKLVPAQERPRANGEDRPRSPRQCATQGR